MSVCLCPVCAAFMLQWLSRVAAIGTIRLSKPQKFVTPGLKQQSFISCPCFVSFWVSLGALLISHSGTQARGHPQFWVYVREERVLEGLVWTIKCLAQKWHLLFLLKMYRPHPTEGVQLGHRPGRWRTGDVWWVSCPDHKCDGKSMIRVSWRGVPGTFHFFFEKSYWSIVDLQFLLYSKVTQFYIYIFSFIFFSIMVCQSQDIEYSSLCYTVGPCCLSILYTIVCLC